MRSPDMGDLTLRGTDYKLFTYPFLLGQHRMVLCGMMKTEVYNTKLHTIPVGTSYTLVICLVLFLLSLPFLKIFMMNVNDRIYAFNLAIGIVFLFLMASFYHHHQYPAHTAQSGEDAGTRKPRFAVSEARRFAGLPN